MTVSRNLAISILRYLRTHPKFKSTFFVVCQEYGSEDDDFVEIGAEEWESIVDDERYQTFQLWQHTLDEQTIELVSSKILLMYYLIYPTRWSECLRAKESILSIG